jgi:glycosyltransferase involved in cell wall biosynthesis
MTINKSRIVPIQEQTVALTTNGDVRLSMRVTYDHQIFSWQKYGGVSRYFFEVARRIREFDGYDVRILSPLFANKYLKNDHSLSVWGRYVETLPKPTRVAQIFNAGLVKWKLHRDSPDIVHETYYLGKKLASSKSKTVVTVFDMIHEKFPECFPKNDRTVQFKKASIQRADHIICISENTRSDLIEMLGVGRDRTSVVHLAHSLNRPVECPVQRVTDRPYIVYVGARDGYKNFSGLIRALGMSELLKNNFSLVCFGGGPFKSKEREEMAREGIPPDRTFNLQGGDELLENVYRGAAALVYPSLYEGFGLPPLEAMSVDCPVVTSRTSSLPEVCGEAAEYFDPDRPEAMAIAIEHAVASNERRQELIALGRLQVKRFSWDTCAKQTAAIYDVVSKL